MNLLTFKEYLKEYEGLSLGKYNNSVYTSYNRQRRIWKRWKDFHYNQIEVELRKEKEKFLNGGLFYDLLDGDRLILGIILVEDIKKTSLFRAKCEKYISPKCWGVKRLKRRILLDVTFDITKNDITFPIYLGHVCIEDDVPFVSGEYIEFNASITMYPKDSFSGGVKFSLGWLRDVKKIDRYEVPEIDDSYVEGLKRVLSS